MLQRQGMLSSPETGGSRRVNMRSSGRVSRSTTYIDALVSVTACPSFTNSCSVTMYGGSSFTGCNTKQRYKMYCRCCIVDVFATGKCKSSAIKFTFHLGILLRCCVSVITMLQIPHLVALSQTSCFQFHY